MTVPAGARLRAERLTKAFGGRRVVDEVTIEVAAGEVVGLLGPNGAGKTTALKIVYGFLRPSHGTVFVEGIDVLRRPKEVKRLLGIVPQENTLDPDLDGRQNLAFHARYSGIPAKQARERIERLGAVMGLEGHLSSPLGELSSGLRRRLVLARALLGEPAVVILDEPTRGLDRRSRGAFIRLMLEMKGRGVSFLLATHELDEARDLCDEAAVMEGGRVLEIGRGSEIVGLASRRHAAGASEE